MFGGRSSSDKRGAAVVHLAVVPPAESERLCLLAVTADGRRVYLSTQAPGYGGGLAGAPGGAPQRPTTLRADFARPAPPSPGDGRGAARCAHTHHAQKRVDEGSGFESRVCAPRAALARRRARRRPVRAHAICSERCGE